MSTDERAYGDEARKQRSRRARKERHRVERAFWAAERALALSEESASAREEVRAALAEASALDEEERRSFEDRLDALLRAEGREARSAYAERFGLSGVRRFETSGGIPIFRIVAETFPRHVNYLYLLETPGPRVLWDVGSGLGTSRDDVLAGFEVARAAFGAKTRIVDLDVLVISHGHIDHFGDVAWFQETSGATVWVHELDARVLEHFTERTVLTSRDMAVWLSRAGIGAEEVKGLVAMYLASKELFRSSEVRIDRRLRHGQRVFGGRGLIIHTPGHCPGHVCLQLDDILLVADQVLSPITPHISPQALNPYNGLERYLEGLGRLRTLEGIRLVLSAHYDEIPDLGARIDAIFASHIEKLRRVREVCQTPRTVAEVAEALYGAQEGYNVILALLEAGAHVEYLHAVGSLVLADLDALIEDETFPFRYRATEVFETPDGG